MLAEYLVARALGLAEDGVRDRLGSLRFCDARGREGGGQIFCVPSIWFQDRPSRISFVVTKTRFWDAATNRLADEVGPPGGCLCLRPPEPPGQGDHQSDGYRTVALYVLPTSVLDARTRSQHSISLQSLCKLCSPVAYHDLAEAVARAASAPPARVSRGYATFAISKVPEPCASPARKWGPLGRSVLHNQPGQPQAELQQKAPLGPPSSSSALRRPEPSWSSAVPGPKGSARNGALVDEDGPKEVVHFLARVAPLSRHRTEALSPGARVLAPILAGLGFLFWQRDGEPQRDYFALAVAGFWLSLQLATFIPCKLGPVEQQLDQVAAAGAVARNKAQLLAVIEAIERWLPPTDYEELRRGFLNLIMEYLPPELEQIAHADLTEFRMSPKERLAEEVLP